MIKRAKKIIPEGRVIDYLSKIFALRIARGAKIFVNNNQLNKPEFFDSNVGKEPLFQLSGGAKIYGNLKQVEKPKTDNIDLFVKKIFVSSKGFGYKVEGWINCDQLELTTSRDEVYEGNEVYTDFISKLMRNLEKNFEKKSENIEKHVKSEKKISEFFVNIIKSIHLHFPEITKPFLSGNISNQPGIRSISNLSGEAG